MNKEHENFDIGLEFLCTISPAKGAESSVLANDLEMKPKNISRIIQSISDKFGVEISTTRGDDDDEDTDYRRNFVFISEDSKEKSKELCERYWNSVYGEYAGQVN